MTKESAVRFGVILKPILSTFTWCSLVYISLQNI